MVNIIAITPSIIIKYKARKKDPTNSIIILIPKGSLSGSLVANPINAIIIVAGIESHAIRDAHLKKFNQFINNLWLRENIMFHVSSKNEKTNLFFFLRIPFI